MAGDRTTPGLGPELVQWLATVAAEPKLAVSLDATILPGTTATAQPGAATDSGQRAAAELSDVAALSPTSASQLRRGALIAEGGMGQIHAAFQVSVGRTVAVKTLRPERRDARGKIDLLREAWITGAVEHPNVVPVHYVGLDDDGHPVVVLKKVQGVEWSKLVGNADEVQRRFGTTDLLAWNLGILMQLLNALRFAHARGIVHRDLKPSNVMIGEFGEVYLLDWGIAVSLRDDELGRFPLASRATEMAGTPVYMAPEMLGREGAPNISERTDIYLAGAVLYELITGKPPHIGATMLEVITNVAQSQPAIPTDAPTELATICRRAMQPVPADRYGSVDEMRAALVAFLEHRGSARLLDVANERLGRLLEVLAAARADTAETNDEIYRLFGAARFGFHEALAAWRDNAAATSGLVRATTAVAEYELAGGDPRAAVGLLSELSEPPAELLERAKRAVAEQAEGAAAAERLRRDHDVAVGTRTRTLIMIVLAVFFVGTPLVQAGFGIASTYGMWTGFCVLFILVVAAFAIWARESLMATVLNRRMFMTVEALFLAHLLMLATGWRLGLTIEDTEILLMMLWVVFSAMAAIAIDARLAFGCLVYLLAFALVLQLPNQRYYIMAGGNLVYATLTVAKWWPETWSRNEPT